MPQFSVCVQFLSVSIDVCHVAAVAVPGVTGRSVRVVRSVEVTP